MRMILALLLITRSIVADESMSRFKSRLFSKNIESGLLKFRVDFSNARFLTPGSRARFRTNINIDYYCEGIVLSKSVSHFLLKLSHPDKCSKYQNLTLGLNADFISGDFEKNISSTYRLIQILNKKRMAIYGKLKETKIRLDSFLERTSAVNARYDAMRDKLETERQEALGYLESEKIMDIQNFKNFSSRLDEIDFKLEKYKVLDSNNTDERWSLDYSKTEIE